MKRSNNQSVMIRLDRTLYDRLVILAVGQSRTVNQLMALCLADAADRLEAASRDDETPSAHWTSRVYGGKRGQQ